FVSRRMCRLAIPIRDKQDGWLPMPGRMNQVCATDRYGQTQTPVGLFDPQGKGVPFGRPTQDTLVWRLTAPPSLSRGGGGVLGTSTDPVDVFDTDDTAGAGVAASLCHHPWRTPT